MDTRAVPQRRAGLRLAATATLAAALSLACFATPSSAAPLVGRDGTVHACYKVRGKAKGTVRLVSAHARCRRGERKAAWSAVGPAGSTGGAGATGDVGPPGPSGLPGEAALEAQVDELTETIETMETRLAAVCTQATALTTRANALGTALAEFGLGGTIPPLLQLTVPKPLTALTAFSCP